MSLANSFSSFLCLDVLGLSRNDEFSSFCFKIKLAFFVSRQLDLLFFPCSTVFLTNGTSANPDVCVLKQS